MKLHVNQVHLVNMSYVLRAYSLRACLESNELELNLMNSAPFMGKVAQKK